MPERRRKLVKLRDLERAALTNAASLLRFRRWAIPGDGDCMYTALWCGLHQRFDLAGSSAAKEGGRNIRHSLSTILKQHVWDNKFNHQFGYNEAQGVLANELNLGRNTNMATLQHAYYEGVGRHLYGDNLTKELFELVWNVDVVVYEQSRDDDRFVIRQTPTIRNRKPLTVYLLNVNSNSFEGAHFDLLQPWE